MNRSYRNFLFHLCVQFILLALISILIKDRSPDALLKDQLNKYYYRANKPPDNSQFVIIEIDDLAFDWLSSSLGSLRISMAKLIMHLEKFKPKALVAFFLFYGKGLPQENLLLTAAVEKFPDTFLLSKTGLLGDYFTPLEAYTAKTPLFGFFEPKSDRDGIIRSIPLAKEFGTFIQHDLSSQIAALHLKESGDAFFLQKEQHTFNLQDQNANILKSWSLTPDLHLLLRYFFKPADCHRISAYDIVKGNVDLSFLNQKIVLIEGTASVFQNLHKTPFGIMSMATLFLNAIQNLHISQVPEKELKNWTPWMIIFFTLSLSYLILINTRGYLGILSVIALIGMFSHSAFLAYQNGIILPYTLMLTALILPPVYHFINGFVALYRQSSRWLRLASLDPYTGLYSFKFFSFQLQRMTVLFRKKRKAFVLAGCVFYHPNTGKILSFSEIDQRFIKTIGKKIYGILDLKKTAATDPAEGIIYFIYPHTAHKFQQNIKTVIASLETVIQQMEVDYKLCTRYLIISPSSPHAQDGAYMLMQKLQLLFRKIPLSQTLETSLDIEIPQHSGKHQTRTQKDYDLDFLSLLLQEEQKEMEHIKNQLKQSVQEYTMAQKFSAMGQLSSYYAHELKNPLHNMLNCFDTLQDPDENPLEKNRTLSLLKSELMRVIDLTQKMGSYFKPSLEKPVEANLNTLIREALQFLNPTFEKNKIHVVTEFDTHMPTAYLVADQLKQVFLNFFLNAMDAMQGGGTLIIATFYSSSVARIIITDTGTGIDPLSLQKIFHAFYTTKENKGSGLGLFVCYNIVKHHGGQIKVNSTPEKGTCFEIILPL